MAMYEHTQETLRADLRKMGIRAGDLLIVHSSMKSIGRVRGGPRAVVRALQRAVGPRGTILMPTFSYGFERVDTDSAPYDPDRTPAQTGLLPETFRRMPGVRRSGHPTHSVAAWGQAAREMVEGHERLAGLAVGSPFERAARRGAKIVMIGCNFVQLSLIHVAEELAEAPYLPVFPWWHRGWKPTARIRQGHGTLRVSYPAVPGCSHSFGAAQEWLQRQGLVRHARLGNAAVLLAEAEPVLERIARRIRRQPDFLLCPPSACRPCDERRMVFEKKSSPEAKQVGDFVLEVVAEAGIRVAGSWGENRAAEIVAGRMNEIGLSGVATHRFPITAWTPGVSTLSVEVNGRWEILPSGPGASGPATGRRPVEGHTVNLESFDNLAKARATGAQIAVLWEGCGQSSEDFRRLMTAGFKGLIVVDRRFHHAEVVACGVPAQWSRHFSVPMLSVSFTEAVRVFGRGSVRCRLTIASRRAPGESTVVTGDLPGSGPGVILVGGHHDSTFNSVSADDNLSGLAAMWPMIARLKGRVRRHTIRFCSFGTEEALSEGARWYALESGLAKNIRFVLNNDSIGARVGTTNIYATGGPDLTVWLKRQVARSSLQMKIIPRLIPFSDHFPFNILGVPSLWFYRETTLAGRHYHHTVLDTPAEMSFQGIADLAAFQAKMLARLAATERLPFGGSLPPGMRREIQILRKQWATP